MFTNGPMVVNTMVLGLTTRWMDRACSPGRMRDAMTANTLTTKRKGMVYLPGQTVVSTKGAWRDGKQDGEGVYTSKDGS